jgi:hypothetical protein
VLNFCLLNCSIILKNSFALWVGDQQVDLANIFEQMCDDLTVNEVKKLFEVFEDSLYIFCVAQSITNSRRLLKSGIDLLTSLIKVLRSRGVDADYIRSMVEKYASLDINRRETNEAFLNLRSCLATEEAESAKRFFFIDFMKKNPSIFKDPVTNILTEDAKSLFLTETCPNIFFLSNLLDERFNAFMQIYLPDLITFKSILQNFQLPSNWVSKLKGAVAKIELKALPDLLKYITAQLKWVYLLERKITKNGKICYGEYFKLPEFSVVDLESSPTITSDDIKKRITEWLISCQSYIANNPASLGLEKDLMKVNSEAVTARKNYQTLLMHNFFAVNIPEPFLNKDVCENIASFLDYRTVRSLEAVGKLSSDELENSKITMEESQQRFTAYLKR